VRVAVLGGTGLIGRRLTAALRARGDEVTVISRGGGAPAGGRPLPWDPAAGPFPAGELDGLDAAVNLAGEPVLGRPWTPEVRAAIRESRLRATNGLVAAMAAAADGPRTLVSASAVGYYGSRPDPVDEAAPRGSSFLAGVCADWEQAARGAEGLGARVVLARIGAVLAREGGALPLAAAATLAFLGGPLGDGLQWIAWVGAGDVVGLLLHALDDPAISGPLNVAAPAPVRQWELAAALGLLLMRPAVAPIPAPLVRLAAGGMADLLLASHRVVPARALAAGYRFRHPTLLPALRAELAGAPALA
jgi:uncharacterized protein (TIGR01777 family)